MLKVNKSSKYRWPPPSGLMWAQTCLLLSRWPGTLNALLQPQEGKGGTDGEKQAGNCHCCPEALSIARFPHPPGLSSFTPPSPPQKLLPVDTTREPLSHPADSEGRGEAPRASTSVRILSGNPIWNPQITLVLKNESYKLQFISTIRTFHYKLN